MNRPILDRETFIRANTSVLAPPLVPEVRLHLAHEAVPIWQKTEEELGEIGLPPPFWAFAWAGGQALARYVLDRPEIVRGRSVVDLASGSGLVGIAALKAGASSMLAADIDPFAVAAIRMNVELSEFFPPPCGEGQGWGFASHAASHPPPSVLPAAVRRSQARPREGEGRFAVTSTDLLASPPPVADVILVGDLFYEKSLAERVFGWLRQAEAMGIEVLIGDPGRSYLPRESLEKVIEYTVPVSRELEDAEIKRSAVWRLGRNC